MAFRWLAAYWLHLSTVLILLAIAVAAYAFIQPSPAALQNWSLDWVALIWTRNLVLAIIVAGSLHLYLHTFRRQGTKLKYEARELDRSGKIYTFNNQVLDNMLYTLASGVAVWSAYEATWLWAHANGYVPHAQLMQNPVWFVALFVLIPLWSSFHFYVIHKLLHWPPLFRLAHALHHRNVNIGPWSGISMHPIEHLLYFSSVAIHFIVASHPVHFLFHVYYQGLGPMASHSGFDGLLIKDKKRMELGDFFHQLHHKHFKCNYGTSEMPWDRWFGSFHDGSDEATARIRKRRF